MANKIVFILMVLVLTTLCASAQSTAKAFYESVIKNEDYAQKQPIAIPYVDPADVIWARTVWRELILREKMNLPLYYPTKPLDGRMSLIDAMLLGIEKSFKTAYSDDELQVPITMAEIKTGFDAESETIQKRNPDTGEMEEVTVEGEFRTDEVKRLRVKELWYFNKKTSCLEVRIIAMCPVREYVKEGGYDGILKKELFWIDFEEFRDVFVKQKVYNYENDAVHLSLDDIFLKRFFNSRIYKESNVYDNRTISSYTVGMDAVLESDRVKNEIFNQEQDLWQY